MHVLFTSHDTCYKKESNEKLFLTLISPDLIFAIAPMSRTGVFPVAFLSSNGPVLGLSRPNLQVSPSIRCEQRMRI